MEHLKAYFIQDEANSENLATWAKVHDQTALWISRYGTVGKLLDAGCRRGDLKRSKYFPHGVEYFGIDPIKVTGFDYDFEFRCETLEATGHREKTFDFVVIKDSVDYLEDPARAFASAFRVLKRGGYLLISEDGFEEPAGAFVFAFRILKRCSQLLAGKDGYHQTGTILLTSESTYPNGNLSKSHILDSCSRAGFRVVESHIDASRLFISAIR